MDEIRGPVVQIALFLKEGRGFSTVKYPLYIEASLDNHYLDTGVIPPSAEPQLGQELAWIFDRKRLRMLRIGTGHIRVNCYAVIGPNRRENIGILILNLKNAQIQTDSRTQVTQTWHRLIGQRPPHLELLLSYCVRCVTSQQYIAPNSTTFAENEMLRCGGDHVDISPELQSEQGIIQIGPASIGTDIFLLTVVIAEISNLHLLLPKNVGGNFSFHFCYTLCGHTINTKNFTVDPTNHAIALDNGKLFIRIRSSLSVLKTYFDSQSVVPFLMLSGGEVASTSVDLKTLVPTDSIEDLCSKYSFDNGGLAQKSRCYFTSAKTQQVPVGEDGSKPSVDVILRFKFVERQVVPTVEVGIDDGRTHTLSKHQSIGEITTEGEMLQQLCTNSFSAPQLMDNPQNSKHSTSSRTEQSETKQSCSLDKPVKDNQEAVSQEVPVTYFLLEHKSMLPSESVYSEAQSTSYPGKKNLSESQSQETVYSHLGFGDRNSLQPVHHLARSVVADRNDALHRYDLNIKLESVQFSSVFPEVKVFFKFYHPNAEVMHGKHTEVMVDSAGEDLPLRDVSCKLGIHATPSTISHLLLASHPRVIMCSRTTGEQTLVLASTALDTAPLLCTDKRECCFSKSLRNISTREQVAIVKVSMLLEDLGMQMMSGDHARRNFAEYSVGMAVPNEMELYKIVEELEEWKEKQQEIFKVEIREKEKAHLALLMDEWCLKKSEMESVLKIDFNKCSKMKEELENAEEDLRLEIEKITEREKQFELLKEKLESEWTQKIQELEEIRTKMEHDVDEVLQWKEEKAELKQTVVTLQQELKLWKDTVKLRDTELEEVKKCYLTKDRATLLFQEMKMIEEKLEAALKLKSFYKEQWARIMREVLHNQDGLQISIRRNERDQLKNQGAAKILHETEAAKKEDQNILKLIKEKAKQSWLNLPNHLESSDATRGSQSESCIMSTTPRPVDYKMATEKSSWRDMEQVLHGMIVERDGLLRTGIYSMDDPIIAKLNQDMRLLLAQLKTY